MESFLVILSCQRPFKYCFIQFLLIMKEVLGVSDSRYLNSFLGGRGQVSLSFGDLHLFRFV